MARPGQNDAARPDTGADSARHTPGHGLLRSQEELQAMANAIPQLAWIARFDGTVAWYNERWYEYTGLPREASPAGGWADVYDPDTLPAIRRRWQEALRSGQAFEMEFPIRGADGHFRWFLTRANPVRDADGRLLRWFGTSTDVDQVKRVQEALRGARAEAERNSQLKDEFLATLSHELRTPLNAILGWAQVLRRGNRGEADLHRGLQTIERNARAQAQLIEDLLDMSRIASGKVLLDMQLLQPQAAVDAALEAVRPAADAKAIHLEREALPTGPVAADPGRLQQVVWNLLSNAIKFTPRGGAVRVSVAEADGHVGITVADTGIGIAPAFLVHVFDRFRQADATTTRRHGGLGLGLSIVKQLAEQHGGNVSADSAGEGRGASFTVCLPLAGAPPWPPLQPMPPLPAAPAAAARPGDEPPLLDGARVLVVDDDMDARDLVKRILSDHHADVLTAASAAEALPLVEQLRPDLLLSDIGMPGVDGFAFLARVRALGAARGGAVPAIALTAFARSEDRLRVLDSGFAGHIAKPVEPAELLRLVAMALRHH